MIENAHEEHEIKALVERSNFINGKRAKLDIATIHGSGKACLRKIILVAIDAEGTARTSAFHFDTVEAGIAADIKYALARKIVWNKSPELILFDPWIIAKKMIRGRCHALQFHILEPWSKCCNPVRDHRTARHDDTSREC